MLIRSIKHNWKSIVVLNMIKWIHRIFWILRVPHWIKNLFIFIPVFFAGQINEPQRLINLGISFFSFSFIASFIYIFNDLNDIQSDLQHPTKKHRPIASGKISKKTAVLVASALLVFGFVLASFLDYTFIFILATYVVINIFYSIGLKNVPIIDITIISVGFLLRILAGGVIGDVPVSKWLVLLTFFLSMILALAKRRDDLVLMEKGINNRLVSKRYNLPFIDVSLAIMVVITVMSYIMYTMTEEVVLRLHSEHIYLTSILVVLGLLRYLQITLVYERSSSPTRVLLTDLFLQLIIFVWLCIFFFILYL